MIYANTNLLPTLTDIENGDQIQLVNKNGVVSASLLAAYVKAVSGGGGGTVFNSNSFPLTDGTALNTSFNTSLTLPPSYMRMVLLCTASDTASGLSIGNEFDVDSGYNYLTDFITPLLNPVFSMTASSGSGLVHVGYSGIAGTSLKFYMSNLNKTGVNGFTSMTNFSLKIYWAA